ncbi:MAG: lipoate--protein ligase, partial [Bacillota bacterium]|nr:lipoate--protein ligase [Bacillota bacterium]
MRYVDQGPLHRPALNLAIEEYLLRQLRSDEDYLFFYNNDPSVIIGRNQNAWEEIDEVFCRAEGIQVVRRLSGGGAVYTDRGNLSFSFITRDDGQSFMNFKKFTEPVVEALRTLGVPAELTGRNDIQVGERKISGNAQYAAGGRLMTHGTLLLSVDLERMTRALQPRAEKFQSKSTKSVRARVAN